jgi:hypothetical protein
VTKELHTASDIGLIIMIAKENIKAVRVADLVPTQMTVGMREVSVKRRRWRERSSHEAANYLNILRIPVVLGPNARYYLIDRHHLALALRDEGIGEIAVSLVANMSTLSFDAFWISLERKNWTHPFDDWGRRRRYNDMPETIDTLQDDPFRSLAGAVKRAGGYAKDETPFSEFKWADFLRRRIARRLVERDFGRALAMAMHLAHSAEAAALPGWRARPASNGVLRVPTRFEGIATCVSKNLKSQPNYERRQRGQLSKRSICFSKLQTSPWQGYSPGSGNNQEGSCRSPSKT